MSGSRRLRARCLASLAVMAVGDGIDQPLTPDPGDAARGLAVVTRQSSTCTLCHAGPFPNPHLQGDVGPDLRGVGARLSPAQLRLRLVQASRLNPATVMPDFYRTEGLTRVGPAWRGKPALGAQEIEDAVAYLSSLK